MRMRLRIYFAAFLLCGINVGPGQANGHQFVLSLPVFAMIQKVRASVRSRRMEIAITNDSSLPPLKGRAEFWGPRTVVGEPPKRRVTIQAFSGSGGNKNLRGGLASIRLLNVLEKDTLEVKACSCRCSSMRGKHPFKKSISNVCWPILRSSCATRPSSQRRLPGPGNTLPGPSRNSRYFRPPHGGQLRLRTESA